MVVVAEGLSLDEFLRLPEQKPALEYFDGVVTQKVSPKGRHSQLQWRVGKVLEEAAGGAVAVYPELRATYGGMSTVPDLSVYRLERIPVNADDDVNDEFRQPPDIAVEIVSPDQHMGELRQRCRWYAANGVRCALLIDPDHRTVSGYFPGQGVIVWKGADRMVLGDVLPRFDLTVQGLFALLKVRSDERSSGPIRDSSG